MLTGATLMVTAPPANPEAQTLRGRIQRATWGGHFCLLRAHPQNGVFAPGQTPHRCVCRVRSLRYVGTDYVGVIVP